MREKLRLLDHAELLQAQEAEARARCYENVMERWYRFYKGIGTTTAGTKEEFYGFQSSDVIRAHSRKAGLGAGIFYRLWNGRVFDVSGEEHEADLSLYDQTIH